MPKYVKITVAAPAAYEEPITMLMLDQGAAGVEVSDPALIKEHLLAGDWDASVFDGQEIVTGDVTLSCLLEGGREAALPLLEALAALSAKEALELQPLVAEAPDTDWQRQWKEAFQPLAIGDKLYVRPSWDESPIPEGRVAVNIEPGMAFGTGDHATTAMMLALLEEYLQPGGRILDVGCGSGILGIAGLKLGASSVIGVDIDEVCVAAVADHLRLNGIREDDFAFILGDILAEEKLQRRLRQNKAQLVLANINAHVIFDLTRVVGRFLAPGGVFLCSGIIADQGGVIANRLVSCGLAILNSREQDGWCAFAAVPSYE